MCDYIPTDPTLSDFHEPVKCPHEQIFYSAVLTDTGELTGQVMTAPACWQEAVLKVEPIGPTRSDGNALENQ